MEKKKTDLKGLSLAEVVKGKIPDRAPELPAPEEIVLISKNTQKEIRLNWAIIRRSLDVLLKLAPMELRTPEEFLDQVYEQKRMLAALYVEELKWGYEAVLETITEQPQRPDECGVCFADNATCLSEPGSAECIARRDKYAQQA